MQYFRMEREIDLEKQIGELFLDNGVFCQKTPKLKTFGKRKMSGRLSLNGQPDLFIVHKGRYIAIEVKLPGCQQSPDQKEFEKRLRAAGANYYVVRSLADAVVILRVLERI
jgi:hypothetical protein